MQRETLQPLAEKMFAAAAVAFSQLAGGNATSGLATPEQVDGSIKVEAETVATLTRLPSSGATFVSRFVKADIGHVVEMMLGTPGEGGELDAMQLSIVAETVAQVATAMGEKLAAEAGVSHDGIHSEVVNETGDFPAPPFTSFSTTISIGEMLLTTVIVDFDGLGLTKLEAATQAAPAPAPAAAPPPPPSAAAAPSFAAAAPPPMDWGAAPAPPPPPPPPLAGGEPHHSPRHFAAEGQPAAFAPMAPTPVRPAPPGQANLDLVHDVPLEISAVLGQTELSLREVVAMQPGSVFELDKLSTEPIDLYVNNILIARGEVVVVDDKFAVKISELNPVVDKL